ncbi:reverse transcriptase domain-containing protein [Tanacetum coccineum]
MGGMLKWKFKLEGYDIKYRPRASIKGQILADFIVEQPVEESPDVPMTEPEEMPEPWTVFTDGSSCIDGSGARLILTNPEGVEFTYAMRFRHGSVLGKGKRAHKQLQGIFHQASDAERKQKGGRPKQDCIDYFTKWIEAKPVATITGNQVKKFVWDNIVCRFGLPGEIVSDDGKQFCETPFKDWCEKQSICQCFASVKHPQTNCLVEKENRSLGEGIKARLEERSKDWMGELSHVLWAHRTMIKSSNRETPFSLTYGTEAVIPAEIGMPTLRTAEIDLIKNDEALEINLDLIEEKR